MSTLLNTVDTYLSLQPFKSVEQLNQNTIAIREKYSDQLTLSTKKVLDVLHRYAVKYLGVCYLSKNKIADMVGVSRRTVIRACNTLEDLGVIKQYELKRHNGDKRQSSNAIVFVDVTPECHTKEALAKTQKSLSNTLDTGKADFDKKEVVKDLSVDKHRKSSDEIKQELKRGLRDKMPAYIYDTLAPYFNLDELYQAYGALIRGKAFVDRSIQFETYEGLFKDAILSVINAYKRGVVRNIFAVMYAAARDTSAQIYRQENWDVDRLPFGNWLEWD